MLPAAIVTDTLRINRSENSHEESTYSSALKYMKHALETLIPQRHYSNINKQITSARSELLYYTVSGMCKHLSLI